MVDEREPVPANQPPRRPRALLTLAAVLLVVAVGAGIALVLMPAPTRDETPPTVPTDTRPSPMQPIALDRLPPAPTDPAVIAAARAEVRARQVPALAVGLDPETVAWLRACAEDEAAAPSIPQRLAASDLVAGGAPVNTAAVVRARVDDRVPAGGEDGWQWLLLWLGDDQYAVALAPPAAKDLVIGADARVVGRYLGRAPLPTADGEQSTPVFTARLAAAADGPVESGAVDPLAVFHVSRLVLPADLYEEVVDERPLIETRPYYYLLGQAKYDSSTPGVYDDALDANRYGSRLHRAPDEWRGKPVTVAGRVIQAWRDDQAVTDRPFEVTEVWRVQMVSTDSSEITEKVGNADSAVDKTSIKLVSRLFEVAIAGPQPPPKVGERIAVTGRFLKWRKIPVSTDPDRDRRNQVTRQSDAIYALFVVAPEWRSAPLADTGPWSTSPRVLWTMLAATLGAAVIATAAAIVGFRRGDRSAAARHPRRHPRRRAAPPPDSPSAPGGA